MVPVGELPRHMMLHAERYLTAKVTPGSRIIATGIYSTFAPSKGVSYIDREIALELTDRKTHPVPPHFVNHICGSSVSSSTRH
jgi:DNA replicative helicase MCM subunit Mcm2 (Cdc46/Mcm family)